MIRNILLIIMIFLYTIGVEAQALGQDSDGFSTVLVPTTTLNLDINSTTNIATFAFYRESRKNGLKFSDYNPLIDCRNATTDAQRIDCIQQRLNKIKTSFWNPEPTDLLNKKRRREFITYGIDIKGGTKDGVGTLLTNEKVANSVSLSGLLGYNWNTIYFNNNAARNIAGSYKEQLALDSVLAIVEKNVDPKLVKTVNIATKVDLDASAYSKLEEKIGFYKSRIKILNDTIFLQSVNRDNLAAIKTRKSNLTALSKNIEVGLIGSANLATLETAKQPVKADIEAQKRALYELYVKYQILYSIEFKNELFKDPFDKKNWEAHQKINELELFIAEYKENELQKKADGGRVSREIGELTILYQAILKALEDIRLFNENYSKNNVFVQNVFLANNLLYFKGTFTGAAFKYDLANGGTTIKERFIDKDFNGYTALVGYTRNYRSYNFLGFSAALNYTNNLAGLTTTTYKLETTLPEITGGVFTTSAEIKALSGVYDTFLRYDANFDYIRLIPLKENQDLDGKQSQIYLSINPYLRHRIYEKANELKRNTVVGFGIHAYNSKDNRVMGGVFIQTNDFFGNHAGDDSTLGKRITFGVIAKFAFSGLKIEEKK